MPRRGYIIPNMKKINLIITQKEEEVHRDNNMPIRTLFRKKEEEAEVEVVIQVDIGGHQPFPTGSKQFFVYFGKLLFLTVLTSGAILRA